MSLCVAVYVCIVSHVDFKHQYVSTVLSAVELTEAVQCSYQHIWDASLKLVVVNNTCILLGFFNYSM